MNRQEQADQEFRAWLEIYLRRFVAADHDGVARTMDEWGEMFWQWIDEELKQEQDESAAVAETIQLLDEHCAKWGHTWRTVIDATGASVQFCVTCSAYLQEYTP